MAKRGRKSAASLTVIPGKLGQRPDAPDSLTDDQADVWREVVATKPVDWFGADTWPLLAAYCRSTVTAAHISMRVQTLDVATAGAAELTLLRKLLALRDGEARLLMVLARAMRLTQHSRYTARAAARSNAPTGTTRRPWDTDPDQPA